MTEYICREVVLSKCDDIWNAADETTQTGVDIINTIDKVMDFIESLPSADVRPVKRGKWDGYICSECNVCADYFISGDFYFDEKPTFCPNCGARMDGGAE